MLHVMANPHFGGAERYAMDLCRHLPEYGYTPQLLLDTGVPLDPVPCVLQRSAIRGDTNLRAPALVASALRRLHSDLLNIHDNDSAIPCSLGGRLARVPVVLTMHAFHQRWPALLADHLIAVSPALRDHLLAQHFPADRISLVRNGVDTDWFVPQARDEARRQLAWPDDAVYFLYAGRLARRKGLPMLLRVFHTLAESLPKVRLVLAGTGPLWDELRQLIPPPMASRIEWLGFQADIRPLLAACDCLVVPSDSEGFGLTLVEAMAMQRATIATACGGPNDIVRDRETGLLIPPGQADALLAAMRYMAEHPTWREDAEAAGRQRATASYTLQRQMAEVCAVYDAVLKR